MLGKTLPETRILHISTEAQPNHDKVMYTTTWIFKYQVGQNDCPAPTDTDSKIQHLEHSLKQIKRWGKKEKKSPNMGKPAE